MLFALGSLGVLIYFIHHVAVSIQADEIVARVGAELIERVEKLFPEQIGSDAAVEGVERSAMGSRRHSSETRSAVAAGADGYLQLIDAEALDGAR